MMEAEGPPAMLLLLYLII